MAQPHKGPRRGFNLRWTEAERAMVKARAEAAGLTMNDYVVELVRRDEVDANGCPVWAVGSHPMDQLPGLHVGALRAAARTEQIA